MTQEQRLPLEPSPAGAGPDAAVDEKSQIDICLEVALAHPGYTAAEIGKISRLGLLVVSRRLPELRTLGRLMNGRRRRCDVTGRLCITWFPAEKKSTAGAA